MWAYLSPFLAYVLLQVGRGGRALVGELLEGAVGGAYRWEVEGGQGVLVGEGGGGGGYCRTGI